MSVNSVSQKFSVSLVALALAALSVTQAAAVPVSYTIDPARSVLYVNTDPTVTPANPTGDVTKLLAVTVTEQTPGSGSDSYSGTIAADLTGGVLTFSGGSSIIAALNTAGPPPYTPITSPGTDNYGIKTTAATPTTGGVVFAALRNTTFDLTTGTVQDGLAPSGVNLQVLPGAFASVTIFGALTTAGAGANSTTVPASLTTAAGIETLVLPVTRITGTSAHFVLIGQITATRAVPEPSTMILAGMGVLGLAVAAWRKRK